MARKRRSTLPTITDTDHAQRPDMLRRTATGWAWKCAYCGQFACSETLAGKYVCRSHGGVTARQRDPEAQDQARASAQPVPRPPGRPLKSGLYSRRPSVRVDELVADYQARQLDVDCTDEDMLYLRAYLQELMERRPAVSRLQGPLDAVHATLCQLDLDDRQNLTAWREAAGLMKECRLLLRAVVGYTGRLEERHARLIKLAKVRAETRVKNRAAQQVEVFQIMVGRMASIFEETLPHEHHMALLERFRKELDALPASVVDGTGSVEA